jgi:hypothetical protein
MAWPKFMPRDARHGAEPGKEGLPPPFPTISTFLGIAAVMIVIWLLAYGPPHFFSASEQPVPSNNTEAGTSK